MYENAHMRWASAPQGSRLLQGAGRDHSERALRQHRRALSLSTTINSKGEQRPGRLVPTRASGVQGITAEKAGNPQALISDVGRHLHVAADQQLLQLLRIHGFLFHQQLGQFIEHRAIGLQHLGGAPVGLGH